MSAVCPSVLGCLLTSPPSGCGGRSSLSSPKLISPHLHLSPLRPQNTTRTYKTRKREQQKGHNHEQQTPAPHAEACPTGLGCPMLRTSYLRPIPVRPRRRLPRRPQFDPRRADVGSVHLRGVIGDGSVEFFHDAQQRIVITLVSNYLPRLDGDVGYRQLVAGRLLP